MNFLALATNYGGTLALDVRVDFARFLHWKKQVHFFSQTFVEMHESPAEDPTAADSFIKC